MATTVDVGVEREVDENSLQESLQDTEFGGSGDEEVGSLVRHAVSELESALQESRRLLSERERELTVVRKELDKYRQQVAKEILRKTEISAALDQSRTHALRLESLVERWQQELRESKSHEEKAKQLATEVTTDNERMRASLKETEARNKELTVENSRLSQELENQKKKLSAFRHGQQAQSAKTESRSSTRSPDPDVNLKFLRKAVYHYLTGYHADEQIKVIVAILDFNPQQRKSIYDRQQQRGGWFSTGKS